MKPDNEAPEIVFTWLEDKSYEALSPAERNIVLAYFTREEYENMAEATRLFKTGDRKARKEIVMQAFEQHHPAVRPINSIWTWKLAAALMPVGLIALIFFLKQEYSVLNVASTQTADTVYINREVAGPKEIIHDTVYLVGPGKHQKQKETKHKVENRQGSAPVSMEEMQVFSAAELQTLMEGNKGSSLEEDTLWRRFEAVSL